MSDAISHQRRSSQKGEMATSNSPALIKTRFCPFLCSRQPKLFSSQALLVSLVAEGVSPIKPRNFRRRSPFMIISVLNQKGGVGKTTTTLNLGAALAEAGHRVLLCDLDLQRDLMAYEETLGAPNAHFAATDASDLPALLKASDYDFALLDCPPSLGDETGAALRISDLALVPVSAEFAAVRGLARVLEVIRAAEIANPVLRGRLLVTMLDRRSDHGPTIAQAVQNVPGMPALKSVIPRAVSFAKACGEGQSILSYAPKTAGAEAYRTLALEVTALRASPAAQVSARADTRKKAQKTAPSKSTPKASRL